MDAAAERRVGRFFLSTSDTTKSATNGVTVQYKHPVENLAFTSPVTVE